MHILIIQLAQLEELNELVDVISRECYPDEPVNRLTVEMDIERLYHACYVDPHDDYDDIEEMLSPSVIDALENLQMALYRFQRSVKGVRPALDGQVAVLYF